MLTTAMPYCPRCLEQYDESLRVCWPCRVFLLEGEGATAPGEGETVEGEGAPRAEWAALVPVYRAPDELSALRVKALLEEAGLHATVRSAQIPWVGSVMSNINGYWGRVLVEAEDQAAAAELVADYLASLEGGR